MARVAGVDIPDNKRIEFSLRYIHGVGPTRARQIVLNLGLDANPRVKDLSEAELNSVRDAVDKGGYPIEGDLRRERTQNIRRLAEIGSYRGARHRRGLPTRGQRTKTNARTRRGGGRRAVAGNKRVMQKK